jgi:phosphoribosylcarboxyaminoimidazole (NCAIR) mutase
MDADPGVHFAQRCVGVSRMVLCRSSGGAGWIAAHLCGVVVECLRFPVVGVPPAVSETCEDGFAGAGL